LDRPRSAKASAVSAIPSAGVAAASPSGITMPTPTTGGRSNPWLTLAVVVVVLVLALLFFSIYAEHVAHTHQSGLAPAAGAVVRAVSVLRS
jgi:LPXTG-motif cell wall-anchored protein